MKCPNCNSENVTFVANTQKRGFSFADACCGRLIFGPLGFLCGAIGANKTTTADYWVCNNCGRKFQAKQIEKYNLQFISGENQQTAYVNQQPEHLIEDSQHTETIDANVSLTAPKTVGGDHSTYTGSLDSEALLKRAKIYLEDSEWEKAYEYSENALDIDAENGEAYLAKFMAEYQIRTEKDIPAACSDMILEIDSLDKLSTYGKAMRYGNNELKAKLTEYSNAAVYEYAKVHMNDSVPDSDFAQHMNDMAALLERISDYKGAKELAEHCRKRVADKELSENKAKYKEACEHLAEAEKGRENQVNEYILAIRLFRECGNYSDAPQKYNQCRDDMYNIADELLKEPKNINEYDTAITLLRNTFGYKDSALRSKQLDEARYDVAKQFLRKAVNEKTDNIKKWIVENKKICIAVCCVIAVIILCIIFIPIINNAIKTSENKALAKQYYSEAIEYYDSGDYFNAYDLMAKAENAYGEHFDNSEYLRKYYGHCNLASKKNAREDYLEVFKSDSEMAEKFADKMLSNGYYEYAISMYTHLGATEKYNETKYTYASLLFDNGNYSTAIAYFEELGDYKDSAERIEKYNAEKEALEIEEKYLDAVDAMNDGEYLAALSEFKKISGYKDSDEKYNEAVYALAEDYYNNEEYDNALKFYKKSVGYKDVDEKIKLCENYAKLIKTYNQAVEDTASGKYIEAAEKFKSLGDYKDSAEKAEEAYQKVYDEALSLMEYRSYEAAAELFTSLGDYKDSAEKAREAEKLYQDSLPKKINGAASEERKEIRFDSGTFAYTIYEYYISRNGGEYIDRHLYFDDIELTLDQYNSEAYILNSLSNFIISPEINGDDCYSANPSLELNSYYTEIYELTVKSVTSINDFLFISFEEYINEAGAYSVYGSETEYYTFVYNMTTGEMDVFGEITDDKLQETVVGYAYDSVYQNTPYEYQGDRFYWEMGLLQTSWYASYKDWYFEDDYLVVIYRNIFSLAPPEYSDVCARVPINEIRQYVE